MGKSKNYAQG